MRSEESLILGTPQERVRLLKAGVDGRLIEKLYVELNSFKIVSSHVLFNQADGIKRKTPAASPYRSTIKYPVQYTHCQRRLTDSLFVSSQA